MPYNQVEDNSRTRVDYLRELIADAARRGLYEAAKAMQADALSRTPNKDEEYKALMVGDHDEGDYTPRDGDSSADQDGRVRLQKPEDTYLEETVAGEQNVFVDETALRAGVGNVEWLRSNSWFEYRNAMYMDTGDGKVAVPGEPIRKGPYFDAFEYGSVKVVTPRWRRADGGFYPLRPEEDRKEAAMDKTLDAPVYGRQMFFSDSLETVARISLTTVMAEVGPGRDSNTY